MLGVIAWVGIRGYLAYKELSQLTAISSTVESAVTVGDTAKALGATEDLGRRASSASALTSDPLWRGAELVPFVGANLSAVRTIADAASALVSGAVVPLVTVAQTVNLSDLKPIDGHIDTTTLQAASAQLLAAATVAQRVTSQVDDLDQSGLLPPLATAVNGASSVLNKLTDRVTAISNVALLLPDMVGTSGQRNFIVVVQNNAEVRATGGVPGALALLHADQGKLTLARQSSTTAIHAFDSPVIDLPEGTVNVFGTTPAKILQDTTMTPDFSVTARSVTAMWQKTYGQATDGVLSLDPVTLGYLLNATGPLTLPTGETLTAQNAPELLMNTVYTKYPSPADQDAFFASTAAAVFEKVANGQVDAKALIDALAKAGAENRIFLWNANPAEQTVLEGTTLAGIVPPSALGAFGVYLNDQTASKMDFYLATKIGTGVIGCRTDNKTTFVISVTLTNNAPADAAQSLPWYVTGGDLHGTPAGNIRTSVVVYGAPAGDGVWGEVLRGSTHQDSFATTDGQHSVVQATVELAPGQSQTLTFRYLGNRALTDPISLLSTPLIAEPVIDKLELSCQQALK